ITATMFTEGIKANHLIEELASVLTGRPSVAMFASVALTGSLAVATGSGMAPGMAIIKAIVPAAASMEMDPIRLGALASVAAQLGRTMSPVAAVTIMVATLSGTT